eukprot:gnl/TRDRNA2_/TRDRNA2_162229_c1_seq1.p1 gnl/TRDRNA2_/TRDRNA2_162229_c1~~gnl/TRDRNA2_/TRDRNA2_162229_c1_seq1.p1  ORF type:complete len:645 (-),score=89.15 gnl/TRDRNA2_/TRDRNA2_162229_c1_seq1:16-1950(-)
MVEQEDEEATETEDATEVEATELSSTEVEKTEAEEWSASGGDSRSRSPGLPRPRTVRGRYGRSCSDITGQGPKDHGEGTRSQPSRPRPFCDGPPAGHLRRETSPPREKASPTPATRRNRPRRPNAPISAIRQRTPDPITSQAVGSFRGRVGAAEPGRPPGPGGRPTGTRVAGTTQMLQIGTAPSRPGANAQFRSDGAEPHTRGRLRAMSPRSRRGRGPVVAAARPRRPPAVQRAGSTEGFEGSLPPRRGRATSVTRDPGREVHSEPSDSICYAYCLADGLDVQKLEAAWLNGLRTRATGIAAAAKAAAAAAKAAKNAVSSGGSRERNILADGLLSPELQVVNLHQDLLLIKVRRKDCFVFRFGCLVCWGCSPAEAAGVKQAVTPFLEKPLAKEDIDEDYISLSETKSISEAGSQAGSTRMPPTFERVAIAYALAQSVRLGSLELRIDRAIGRTRTIPETMARTGHVSLSSRYVTKMMGELFVLRNEVNLHTDILDTPEFFWKYSGCEEQYLLCRQHFDVDRRVSILNQRFEVLQDLFDVLEKELDERHSDRLEWVVILLCALEALVMMFRLYTRLMSGWHHPWHRHPTWGSHGLPNATAVEEPVHKQDLAVLPILGPLGYLCRVVLWPPLTVAVGWLRNSTALI